MKRFLALVLSFVLIASLTSCGNEKSESSIDSAGKSGDIDIAEEKTDYSESEESEEPVVEESSEEKAEESETEPEKEEESADAKETKKDKKDKKEEKKDKTKKDKKDSAKGINPDFKAAMDSYEEFYDEYIEFMKKYKDSDGTDLSLITEYTELLEKEQQVIKDFEKWADEDLNEEELEYYIEVQNRVTKKLLEIQ